MIRRWLSYASGKLALLAVAGMVCCTGRESPPSKTEPNKSEPANGAPKASTPAQATPVVDDRVFSGDGTLFMGGPGDDFKYRVVCNPINLTADAVHQLRLNGLPPGKFEFSYEGVCDAMRPLIGQRRILLLSFRDSEKGHINGRGGFMNDKGWELVPSKEEGKCFLTPPKWADPAPEPDPTRGYILVIKLHGEAVEPGVMARPTLTWK